MRTIKILFLLCIILGFSTNIMYAQSPNATNHGGKTELVYWRLPCGGEIMYGYRTDSFIYNKNIYRGSTFGKFIGLETGTVYIFTAHGVHHFDEGPGHYGQNQTWIIHANGKPIAWLKYVDHYTVNANGELVEWKGEEFEWECFY